MHSFNFTKEAVKTTKINGRYAHLEFCEQRLVSKNLDLQRVSSANVKCYVFKEMLDGSVFQDGTRMLIAHLNYSKYLVFAEKKNA